MNLNFSIAGNTCFCFSQSKNITLSDSEDEEHYKEANATNEVVVRKAMVTKEVMETAIRPASHLGKAVENISTGLQDRISQTKAEEGRTREKAITGVEEKIFEEAFRQKALLPPSNLSYKPIKKKKTISPFWKISKKTPKEFQKIQEENLVDLNPSPRVYPKIYKREDNRHLWE